MSRQFTITSPSGATLKTKNKYMDDDVAVQVDGAENVLASNIKNGVTILGVEGTLPPAPSGTLQITENGTYDVGSYASAEVEISASDPSKITLTPTSCRIIQQTLPASSGSVSSSLFTSINPKKIKINKFCKITGGVITELGAGTYILHRTTNSGDTGIEILVELIENQLYMSFITFQFAVAVCANGNSEYFAEISTDNNFELHDGYIGLKICESFTSSTISVSRMGTYYGTNISEPTSFSNKIYTNFLVSRYYENNVVNYMLTLTPIGGLEYE